MMDEGAYHSWGSPRRGGSQRWVRSLPRRTGRSLEEWIALLDSSAPKDADPAAWLATSHGLQPRAARWIVERAEDRDAPTEARRLDDIFAGPHAELRAICERILEQARRLAPDTRVTPCRTVVSLYADRLYAQVRPARGRIDLGLSLGNVPAAPRLVATTGLAKGGGLTHRVAIRRVDDVDEDLGGWIARAYASARRAAPPA